MKNSTFFIALFVSILSLASCENEDSHVPENLIGTWIGICHEDRGTAYLTVSFKSDLTGEIELESPSEAFTIAYFEYSVSDNNIICKGASAGTIGEGANSNFSITFQWEDNRLIPLNQWNYFILTKDGSIETNINGDIVSDQSKQLQGVWISEAGSFVMYFKDSENVTQYGLYEPYSNKFVSALGFQYVYSYKRSELDLYGNDGTSYFLTINELNSESLVMTEKNTGTVYKYKRGSKSDIPTEFVRPL